MQRFINREEDKRKLYFQECPSVMCLHKYQSFGGHDLAGRALRKPPPDGDFWSVKVTVGENDGADMLI